MLDKVSRNGKLVDTARDCFHFVTKFFEPINISAVHIYHSALELSPLSSIVRRLYYHQRRAPFPRVAFGTPNSWDPSVSLPRRCKHFTWSPCGRFFANELSDIAVEIRDPVSSELFSTLTKPGARLVGEPAYSPDGRSLARLSNTALIIWDIQTGGVAMEIGHSGVSHDVSLAWSGDGGSICATSLAPPTLSVDVFVFDIVSGTMTSPSAVGLQGEPHIWAYNKSFRLATMLCDDRACTIDIAEVGLVLSKIESYCIRLGGKYSRIGTFSPTAYRISISDSIQLRIFDIRSSECLLEQTGRFSADCFSSDGSLFAASPSTDIHIWKCTSDSYTPWRVLPIRGHTFRGFHLQFSPTLLSLSLFGYTRSVITVLRLDDPPITTHPNGHTPFAVLSPCGTYMLTGHQGDGTIAITNPLSQTPSHFIDTDMKIEMLALTGNVLLVLGSGTVAAWRLTEEGAVDGVLDDRRAGHGDSIWTIPRSPLTSPVLSIDDQTVTIKQKENDIHIYHMGTGEVLQPAQAPTHHPGHKYLPWINYQRCMHYPHYCESYDAQWQPVGGWQVSPAALEEGWVKDPEGEHQLWIPAEWRAPAELRPSMDNAGWFRNTTTLRLNFTEPGDVIIIL